METELPQTQTVLASVAALTEHMLQSGQSDIYRRVVQHVDRAILRAVMRHVDGNQTQASERLGISRTTLRSKLRAAGLANDDGIDPGPGAQPALNSATIGEGRK